MTILCTYCEPTTNYTETIIISLVSSAIFALIVFLLGLLYDYLKYNRHIATYQRPYKGGKTDLIGQIAAIAKTSYKNKGELIIHVETLINEHEDSSLDYIFPQQNIQEWKGVVTMTNKEAGELYWYYIKPDEQRNEKRSGFKRILFLNKSQYLKLFGEPGTGYFNELFDRK